MKIISHMSVISAFNIPIASIFHVFEKQKKILKEIGETDDKQIPKSNSFGQKSEIKCRKPI